MNQAELNALINANPEASDAEIAAMAAPWPGQTNTDIPLGGIQPLLHRANILRENPLTGEWTGTLVAIANDPATPTPIKDGIISFVVAMRSPQLRWIASGTVQDDAAAFGGVMELLANTVENFAPIGGAILSLGGGWKVGPTEAEVAAARDAIEAARLAAEAQEAAEAAAELADQARDALLLRINDAANAGRALIDGGSLDAAAIKAAMDANWGVV